MKLGENHWTQFPMRWEWGGRRRGGGFLLGLLRVETRTGLVLSMHTATRGPAGTQERLGHVRGLRLGAIFFFKQQQDGGPGKRALGRMYQEP